MPQFPNDGFEDLRNALGVKQPVFQDDGYNDLRSALAPTEPERTLGGTVRDVGVSLAKGVVGIPEMATGLLRLNPVTEGMNRGVKSLTGFDALGTASKRLKSAQDYLGSKYSDAQQAANQRVEDAEGFWGTTRAMVQNPSTIVHSAVESLPTMWGGAKLGQLGVKGLLKAGEKMGVRKAGEKFATNAAGQKVLNEAGREFAGKIGARVGEGLAAAGGAAEQIAQEQDGADLTARQKLLAGAAGLGTAGLSAVSGKIAGKLGITDIDELLAGAPVRQAGRLGKGQMAKGIALGALSEGVLEELPQSAQEQVMQNLATGKQWNEGVAEAAAQGMMVGAAMGGAVNARNALPWNQRAAIANNRQAQEEQQQAEQRRAEAEQAQAQTARAAMVREAEAVQAATQEDRNRAQWEQDWNAAMSAEEQADAEAGAIALAQQAQMASRQGDRARALELTRQAIAMQETAREAARRTALQQQEQAQAQEMQNRLAGNIGYSPERAARANGAPDEMASALAGETDTEYQNRLAEREQGLQQNRQQLASLLQNTVDARKQRAAETAGALSRAAEQAEIARQQAQVDEMRNRFVQDEQAAGRGLGAFTQEERQQAKPSGVIGRALATGAPQQTGFGALGLVQNQARQQAAYNDLFGLEPMEQRAPVAQGLTGLLQNRANAMQAEQDAGARRVREAEALDAEDQAAFQRKRAAQIASGEKVERDANGNIPYVAPTDPVPAELAEEIGLMRQQMDAGEKGYKSFLDTDDGLKVTGMRSTNPVWMRAGNKEFPHMGKAEKKDIYRVLDKIEQGQGHKLGAEQLRIWREFQEAAHKYAYQTPGSMPYNPADYLDQGKALEVAEKNGMEYTGEPQEISVHDIAPGDKVLVRDREGEPDVATHAGYTKDGKVILKDGVVKHLAPGSTLTVEGIKQGRAGHTNLGPADTWSGYGYLTPEQRAQVERDRQARRLQKAQKRQDREDARAAEQERAGLEDEVKALYAEWRAERKAAEEAPGRNEFAGRGYANREGDTGAFVEGVKQERKDRRAFAGQQYANREGNTGEFVEGVKQEQAARKNFAGTAYSETMNGKRKGETVAAYVARRKADARAIKDAAEVLGVSEEQMRDEYDAVAAKHVGTIQWLKAPNGKKTNLTEQEWVLARTPGFKRKYGNWELGSHGFTIVETPEAPFNKASDALAYAVKNGITGAMSNAETGGKGIINISKSSVDEMLNQKQQERSVSYAAHYAALVKLRDIIRESEFAETHPDFKKDASGKRSAANGANPGVTIDVIYGAIQFNGETYRVKTTLKLYAQKGTPTKAYAYDVSAIEVLKEGQNKTVVPTGPLVEPEGGPNPKAGSTVSGNILLNGVTNVKGNSVLTDIAVELDANGEPTKAAMRGEAKQAPRGKDIEVDDSKGKAALYSRTAGSSTIQDTAKALNVPAEQLQKEYDAVVEQYKDTPLWLKAPNGKATSLTEEQWVLARTPGFREKYGDWETLATIQRVHNMEAQRVEAGQELNKKEFEKLFQQLGSVKNEGDNFTATLPNATVGKIIRNKSAVNISTIADYIPALFRNAILAYTENERPMEGHKLHRNVQEYRNYVNKFTVKGEEGEYYIRFTVRRMYKADSHLHSTAISDVALYKKQEGEANVRTGYNPGRAARPLVDNKLRDFFAKVKPEDVRISLDANGEPVATAFGPARASRALPLPKSQRADIKAEIAQGLKRLGNMAVRKLFGLNNTGTVRTVASQSEAERIIRNAQAEVKRSERGLIQGFTMPDGTVYLVEDGIAKGQAMPVLLHELGEHAERLGFANEKAYKNILRSLERRQKEPGKTGDAIRAAMHRADAAGVKRADKAYWSEVAAYLVEENANTKTGFLDHVAHYFKDLLYRMTGIGADLFTHKDLVLFAQSAVRAAVRRETGRGAARGDSVRRSFAGEKGAAALDAAEETTVRMDNRRVAGEMEAAGKDARAIKYATGWERGKDGKWRYEVDDKGVKLDLNKLPGFGEVSLAEVLNAPELFKAYPALKDVMIHFATSAEAFGAYNPETNSIVLNLELYRFGGKDALHTVMHEVQHAIQEMEGFAPGGNKGTISDDHYEGIRVRSVATKRLRQIEKALEREAGIAELRQQIDELEKQYTQDMTWAQWEESRAGKEALKLREELGRKRDEIRERLAKSGPAKTIKALQAGGLSAYRLIAGEVEARNTESRLHMTAEERRNSTAEETEDVAREDQIELTGQNVAESGDAREYPDGIKGNRRAEVLYDHFAEILAAVPNKSALTTQSPRVEMEKNKAAVVQRAASLLTASEQQPGSVWFPAGVKGTPLENVVRGIEILSREFDAKAAPFAWRALKTSLGYDGKTEQKRAPRQVTPAEAAREFETLKQDVQALRESLRETLDEDSRITLDQLLQARTAPWRLVRAYAVQLQNAQINLAGAPKAKAAVAAIDQMLDRLDDAAATMFPVPKGGAYPERLMDILAGTVAEDADVNEGMDDPVRGVMESREDVADRAKDYGRRIREAAAKWAKVVDRALKNFGNPRTQLAVGKTPDLLVQLGVPALDMIMETSTLRKVIGLATRNGHSHGLTPEQVKALYAEMADPVAVLRYEKEDYSIITSLGENGNPVLVALSVEVLPNKKSTVRVNEISSAYGRQNFEKYMEDRARDGKLLYLDKEKLAALTERTAQDGEAGVDVSRPYLSGAFPQRLQRAIRGKVKYPSDVVKPQFEGTDATGRLYQTAWHGSPYRFSKFTLDHIGMGEGSQAYGWGLYFSLEYQAAEGYSEMLGRPFIGNKSLAEIVDAQHGGTYFQKNIRTVLKVMNDILLEKNISRGKSIDDVIGEMLQKSRERATLGARVGQHANGETIYSKLAGTGLQAEQDRLKILEAIAGRGNEIRFENEDGKSGNVYAVDIPEDVEMIRYEDSLSGQSDQVQKAVARLFRQNGLDVPTSGQTGREIYAQLSRALGNDEAASRALNSVGVKGMRYKGGVDGEAAVVFDDQAIQVLGALYKDMGNGASLQTALKNLYGQARQQAQTGEQEAPAQAPAPATPFARVKAQIQNALKNRAQADAIAALIEARAASAGISPDEFVESRGLTVQTQAGPDGVRGAFDVDSYIREGKSIITAFEGAADVTTLAHELAHLFRQDLSRFGEERLLRLAESFCRVQNGKWTREAEERFAVAFEQYLQDGKAPNTRMATVFERFRQWFAGMYNALAGRKTVKLSPEIREVFDALLTTDAAKDQSDAWADALAKTREQIAKAEGRGPIDLDYRTLYQTQWQTPPDAGWLDRFMENHPKWRDRWERFVYNLLDTNDPRERVWRGAGSPQDKDIVTVERLRGKKAAAEQAAFRREHVTPLLELLGKSGLEARDLEEYAHAMHAPERNQRMREVNAKRYLDSLLKEMSDTEAQPYKDMIDLVRAQAEAQGWTQQDIHQFYMQQLDDVMQGLTARGARYQQALSHFNALPAQQQTQAAQQRLDSMRTRLEKSREIRDKWNTESQRFAGISDSEAQDIINKWSRDSRFAQLQDAHNRLLAINQKTLEVLHDSGELGDAEYQAMQSGYQYYVPLHRAGFMDTRPATGKITGPTGKPFHVAKGSMREVVNIFPEVVRAHETAINRAHKLEAGRTLYEFALAHPDSGIAVEPLEKKPTHDREGNITMYTSQAEPEDGIFVKVDGRKYLLRFDVGENTPESRTLARMLDSIKGDGARMNAAVQALHKVTRFLATVNTSLNPEFVVTNFARDFQEAFINLNQKGIDMPGLKKQVLKDTGRAIRGIWLAERGKAGTNDMAKWYRDYEKNGGKVGWLQQYESIDDLASSLEKELKLYQSGHHARKMAHATLSFIESANVAVENALRLSAYKVMVDKGVARDQAARIASSLTVDFTQKGRMSPSINALYMFFNASVQGSVRMAQALAKSPKVQGIAGGIMGLGFTLQMLALMGGGDDETDEPYILAPEMDSVRERNIVFMIPGSGGKYFKVPKPYGYGVFHTIGTELANSLYMGLTGREYNHAKGAMRVVSSMANAFNPIGSATILQSLAPTLVDPLVYIGENKTWNGNPLRPEQSGFGPQKPESQRYWKNTSPVWKQIAEGMNALTGGDKYEGGWADVSPETLEMLWGTATGGTGRFVSNMIGAPGLFATGELDASKTPFVRNVVGAWTDRGISTRYYETMEKAQVARMRFRNAETLAEKQKIFASDDYKLWLAGNQKDKQIRALRKRLNLIEAKGGTVGAEYLKKRITSLQADVLRAARW